MNIEKHAYKVVAGFEELQILIEAALGETVSTALNQTVDELEAVVNKTRKRAGSIDDLGS